MHLVTGKSGDHRREEQQGIYERLLVARPKRRAALERLRAENPGDADRYDNLLALEERMLELERRKVDDPLANDPWLDEVARHAIGEFRKLDDAVRRAYPGWEPVGFNRSEAFNGAGDDPIVTSFRHSSTPGVKFVVAARSSQVDSVSTEFDVGTTVTSTMLKRVRWGDLLNAARMYVRELNAAAARGWHPDMNHRNQELGQRWNERPKRRTRPRTYDDKHYANIAREYAAKETPSRVRELADRHGVNPATMRGWIAQSRERGFLTKPPVPNVAGGLLTAKARAVLNESESQ